MPFTSFFAKLSIGVQPIELVFHADRRRRITNGIKRIEGHGVHAIIGTDGGLRLVADNDGMRLPHQIDGQRLTDFLIIVAI